MNRGEFHRRQYERQGYTVFVGAVSERLIDRMNAIVQDTSDSDLVDGEESCHSWREIPLRTSDALSDSTLGSYLANVLPTAPARNVQWLNVYGIDEYIGVHMDAGGEVQLMIPIEMPPAGSGGEIWIGATEMLLPIGVGDALLFAAHRLRHGTTPVVTRRRVSLNVRMWLS